MLGLALSDIEAARNQAENHRPSPNVDAARQYGLQAVLFENAERLRQDLRQTGLLSKT